MTPEQVARLKARSYALLGAGIAVLVIAYQYATTLPKEGVIEAWVPLMFVGIALVLFIIAGLIWRKAGRLKVEPVKADLSGPQGKAVIGLTLIGFIAMVGSYFVERLVPNDEILGLLLSTGLLVIMAICFIFAARIARKIQRNASTTGVAKE